jgi:hypothetical protein
MHLLPYLLYQGMQMSTAQEERLRYTKDELCYQIHRMLLTKQRDIALGGGGDRLSHFSP